MSKEVQRLQDTYFKRLDHTIERLSDNFGAILIDAQVSLTFCVCGF